MNYAIVNKKIAESSGINIALHRMNQKKTKVILNENELSKFGDPASVAKKFGGKLVNRSELTNLINSEIWNK